MNMSIIINRLLVILHQQHLELEDLISIQVLLEKYNLLSLKKNKVLLALKLLLIIIQIGKVLKLDFFPLIDLILKSVKHQ